MAWVVPGILGAAGLVSQREQGRRQQNAMNDANALNAQGLALTNEVNANKLDSMRRIRALIDGRDYGGETKRSVDRASEVSDFALGKALRRFQADWLRGGGSVGGSTEESVRRQGVTRGVMDPLREFVAQRVAGEHQSKMADEMAYQGIPTGGMADNYFRSAQMSAGNSGAGANYGPSLSMLMRAIQGMMAKPNNRRADQVAGITDLAPDGTTSGYDGWVTV